jgi:arylsulfatase A-like enzyme
VPFCAAWPGCIKAGSRSTRLATLMDVFPTLCAAAGAEFAHPIDGCSFLPALRGHDQPQLDERTVFWVRREGGPRYQGQEYYAVRQGPWKLLHNSPFEPLQLFHLGDDPREVRDVAGTHRPRYGELSGALRRQIQRAGAVPWQKPFRYASYASGTPPAAASPR